LKPSSRDWVHQVVEVMKLRAGLLLERVPEVYTFPHRTFQEYLAGAPHSIQAEFAQQGSRLAAEGAFWHQLVLLAVGRLVYLNGETVKLLALVEEMWIVCCGAARSAIPSEACAVPIAPVSTLTFWAITSVFGSWCAHAIEPLAPVPLSSGGSPEGISPLVVFRTAEMDLTGLSLKGIIGTAQTNIHKDFRCSHGMLAFYIGVAAVV
jgi:hypothetical protein